METLRGIDREMEDIGLRPLMPVEPLWFSASAGTAVAG
jgi:hypothetical protein